MTGTPLLERTNPALAAKLAQRRQASERLHPAPVPAPPRPAWLLRQLPAKDMTGATS